MEWTECLKKAIDYMEENLLNNISAEEVSAEVYMSSFYLQKGFPVMKFDQKKNIQLYIIAALTALLLFLLGYFAFFAQKKSFFSVPVLTETPGNVEKNVVLPFKKSGRTTSCAVRPQSSTWLSHNRFRQRKTRNLRLSPSHRCNTSLFGCGTSIRNHPPSSIRH